MKKFEVGKSYRNTFAGSVITVTKRTAQFIFYTLDGVVRRSKISAYSDDGECITTPAKYMYFAKNEVSDEPAPETEPAVQEAANEPEADATQAAADNKAATMTAQEITARKMIAEQTTEYLLKTFEGTTTNNDPFIPTVRGWLMDELQSRYPEAYDKWLDSEVCEDAALREYINAAIQAEQAATDETDAANSEQAATDNEPEADSVTETRKLYARAHELRLRAEVLNNEGKLHDGFARHIENLEAQAYKAAAHEQAAALAAKNPRVAAAMEKLRARQATRTDADSATEAGDSVAGRPAPQADAASELTDFEREGMRNGAFPMDKDAGIAACKAYREALAARGIETTLTHFSGGLFAVKGVDKDGNLFDVPANACA